MDCRGAAMAAATWCVKNRPLGWPFPFEAKHASDRLSRWERKPRPYFEDGLITYPIVTAPVGFAPQEKSRRPLVFQISDTSYVYWILR